MNRDPTDAAPPTHAHASGFAVVVIGASAGGVDPLQAIARGLPDDLPAAVCIVLHTPAGGPACFPTS